MQNVLHVAALQTPGGLVGQQARINWLESAIAKLAPQRVDLLVLPELYLTGYNVGEKVQQWAEPRDGKFSRQISQLAQLNQLAIHFGYAERDGNELYNSTACYDKTGAMIGHHRKLLLPPGFEGNYFTPGNRYSQIQMGEFRIATLICYDAEFPEAFREVSMAGADLVIVPTALGAQWEIVSQKIIPARAFENGVYVCYVDHCAQENGLEYCGGSCIVGPDGRDLARTSGTEGCLLATLNIAAVKTARGRLPYHIDCLKLGAVSH